ncbi:unnamed protein product [Onchocerca flexuosa]|uniref:Secreted protein n=1 Tax=Onchocerca flexuosa TaxID=387005 RepID=A0A183I3H0_9BILA|nr:unnamed protein product [Onchocerca flexuosa]
MPLNIWCFLNSLFEQWVGQSSGSTREDVRVTVSFISLFAASDKSSRLPQISARSVMQHADGWMLLSCVPLPIVELET